MPENARGTDNGQPANWGLGIAIGIAIGAAIGAALGNIAIGVGIGIALGVAFALLLDDRRTRRRDGDESADD